MGNVCGSSGAHHVYSPQSASRSASASSTPTQRSSLAGHSSSVGGHTLTSVYQLPNKERDKFLNTHDPMKRFGLSANTPVYRTTNKCYVDENGRMAGNPDSGAVITLHEELTPNPFAQSNGFRADEARGYLPRRTNAHTLGVPSLNVMVGPKAQKIVKGYSGQDHVTTKMKLGDFLKQDGKVYTDAYAAGGDGTSTAALLVTLPEGKKVPVKIV